MNHAEELRNEEIRQKGVVAFGPQIDKESILGGLGSPKRESHQIKLAVPHHELKRLDRLEQNSHLKIST